MPPVGQRFVYYLMAMKTYFMRSYSRNEIQFTVKIENEEKNVDEENEKNVQHEPTNASTASALLLEMTLKYVCACIPQWQSMISVEWNKFYANTSE